MKYWAWFALKLVVAGTILLAIDRVIRHWAPKHDQPFTHLAQDLIYTAVMMVFFLVCYGILHIIIWDQKTRCRTCLRKLRMPVLAGSWSNMMLLGQPRTEYICIYGHGTLKIPQVELTGSKLANWQPHDDDIWKELESLESKR